MISTLLLQMMKIKKMVTEVLLSVTNEEIQKVAFEVYTEAKRKGRFANIACCTVNC